MLISYHFCSEYFDMIFPEQTCTMKGTHKNVTFSGSHTASKGGLDTATPCFIFHKVILFAFQDTIETNVSKVIAFRWKERRLWNETTNFHGTHSMPDVFYLLSFQCIQQCYELAITSPSCCLPRHAASTSNRRNLILFMG